MDAVGGDRDALEHDAALAAFGRETGRVPGEDAEFAAELREAMLEEERHLSSDHFRESLMEDKWCADPSSIIQAYACHTPVAVQFSLGYCYSSSKAACAS